MKRFGIVVAVLLVAGLLYLLFWPVPIDPVAWEPAPDPGFTGVFAPNRALAGVEKIEVGPGPEDVALGPDGLLYAGLDDGRIVRFAPPPPEPGGPALNGSATNLSATNPGETAAASAAGVTAVVEGVETFADTGGRPLGMQFDAAGNLIVADAFEGLLSVSPAGEVTLLTDAVGGIRMLFPDDLDIAADGTIWFSDASQRFDQKHFMLDLIEARPTGRLLTHDPLTGETTVRLDGLGFANGVALGPDDAWVLVAETLYARITRLWLTGPRAGEREVFVDALPGHPDNLSYDEAGTVWVALPAPRATPLERLAGAPFLRKVVARIPGATEVATPYSWVVGLDTDGEVVANLQDPEAGHPMITSVERIGEFLYLGSLEATAVARIRAPR